MAKRYKEKQPTAAQMADLEKIADLLFQAHELLEKTDVMAEKEGVDLYVPLLNIIHNRIPELDVLRMAILDADDSDMRCPK